MMVSSVVTAGAIQKTLRLHSEGGILEWPSNIPASEVWIEAIEDKGGASTKLILKFICCERADSVYHTQRWALRLRRHNGTTASS